MSSEFDKKFNSLDRFERLDNLANIKDATNLTEEEKYNYFIKALNDTHDSIRSFAVETLTELYKGKKEIIPILFEQLFKDKFWAVRYLVLKKLNELNIPFLNYKNELIKASNDLKPQIRILSSEIMSNYDTDDDFSSRLVELWKDRDENVRKRVSLLLSESKNPKIQNLMEEYEKKLAEKEKKKKEIAGMFEGI